MFNPHCPTRLAQPPHSRHRALVIALGLAFPLFAGAEELALDAVVVTGSRVAHQSFDLPAAIDVVDRQRINADQPRINASEALAGVPGLSVANRQNYAQDLQISSRGFGARSAFGVRGMRLVADGIPASMPDGQGQAATFNLDQAERIEVMRGPMSALYGNHAGGVVQLFTPDGKGTPTVDSTFVAGSHNLRKNGLSSQGEVGGIGYVIDASRMTSDGYRQHSAVERDQAMAKLTYAPSSDGRFTFIASHFKQQADDPQGLSWSAYQTAPSSVATAPLQYNTRKSIDQQQGGLTYEHRFGDDTLFLSAYAGQRSVIQFQSIPRSAQLILPTTAATDPVRRHSGGIIDFDRDYAGLAARWSSKRPLNGGLLTTSVGLEYESSTDQRRGYENYIGTTLGVQGAQRRKEEDRVNSFDQYVQAEWQGEDWAFNGGLRHSRVAFAVDDQYIATGNGNDSGRVDYGRTTPTIGALYRLTPTVNLYASAARGFETPTLNELFYSGTGGSFSYALQPSTSQHLEGGVKALVGQASRLDVAFFQIKTRDELVVASSVGGRTSYRNAGNTTRRGIEVALDSRWQGGLSTRLAYTALDARYDDPFTTSVLGVTTNVDAGKRLPGVAAQTLFSELVWRHAGTGFHAGLEGVARGKVYVEDSNTQQAAPGYAVANFRMGVARRYGAFKANTFVRVDNLFDRQYVGSVIVGDSNGRFYESAPGRTWLAGVNLGYSF